MKNKFLLLGASALLSTGALMANADTNISGAPAALQASVKFMEPVSITQTQALHFGTLLHPQAEQTVLWNPNNSTTQPNQTSTAQQAFTSGSQAPKIGIMTYSGPNINQETGVRYFLAFSSTSDGTQSEFTYVPLTNGSGESAKTCGSVYMDPTFMKLPNNGLSLQNNDTIYVGGEFTVDENYDNSISYDECTGSVYVTLVVHQ